MSEKRGQGPFLWQKRSLSPFRLLVGGLLPVVVGLPLAFPVVDLLRTPEAWAAWHEFGRLLSLWQNTLLLVAGTLALAMPVGIVGAVLLYRTDLPGRRVLRFLVVVGLFVPLPLFASAWQAALGSGGWLPLAAWTTPPLPGEGAAVCIGWKPWAVGLPAAIWIHAVAGVPWVIVLVGLGLSWVERDLEEDALTAVGPWRVLWHVTLRRSLASIGAAALWVGLQTATEITVTDMMQVRTFAEEVYTQFVRPEAEAATDNDRLILARAVAVALPGVVLAALLVWWAVSRWSRALPPLATWTTTPRLFPLGRARWPCFILCVLVMAILGGVPLGSLGWKAGLGGSPQAWSMLTVARNLTRALQVRGGLVLQSIGLAAAAGATAGVLALVASWLAIESRGFRFALLGLMAAVWAFPAPLLGIGLKDTIQLLLDATGSRSVAVLFYYGPSPLPALWVWLVRFLPCAVAVLWPVVRLVPPELLDSARVDGASPWQELRYVIWPLSTSAVVRASAAVGVLALGEIGASKLVETPGSQTFAHEVFVQMHYGVGGDLAALCLVLLGVVGLAGGGLACFLLDTRERQS